MRQLGGNHTLTLELPKGPSHPCCNSRSSPTYPSPLKRNPRVPHISRVSPFPPASSRGGILSLRGRERIPGVPVASQEEALSTGKARGTPGSCHHCQSPPDVSVHSREPGFPALPGLSAEDRLTPPWHVGKPSGKASWESLMGKSRGKATDPLIHEKGSVTLLLHLGRKAHVYAPNRDEDLCLWGDYRSPEDPCRLWRGILRFRH